MQTPHPLSGIYAAAVTPATKELKPDPDQIPGLMEFYADRGCHGALILGTTGEGPSFSLKERVEIMEAAASIKETRPDFRLLAGTGTPSLKETISLNQAAFSFGYEAVVVLPPYYFRGASEAGLLHWFSEVIAESVPGDKSLLGYHIPQVSGMPLTIELLQQLNTRFLSRFGGLKDSEGKLETTKSFTSAFPDKLILVGNERILTKGLEAGASGAITAMANLLSPWLREIYDNFGVKDTSMLQAKADAARKLLEQYSPFPPSVKFLMAEFADFPIWSVIPPLVSLTQDEKSSLKSQFKEIYVNG